MSEHAEQKTILDRFAIPIAIVLAGAMIALGLIFYGRGGASGPVTEQGGQALTVAAVKDVAKSVRGIDVARVDRLAAEKAETYRAAVKADMEEGAGFGIQGTPSLVINGQLFPGAISYEQVQAALAGTLPSEEGAVAITSDQVATEGRPFIGNPNAPVTIIEWFDYQCGYCKQFEAAALASLEQNEIARGEVKVVFKDFQFFPGSEDVAIWGRALWEAYPDLYGEWRKKVMTL